jgi:hypothetical protein
MKVFYGKSEQPSAPAPTAARDRISKAMGRLSKQAGVPLPAAVNFPVRQPEMRAAVEMERVASFLESLAGPVKVEPEPVEQPVEVPDERPERVPSRPSPADVDGRRGVGRPRIADRRGTEGPGEGPARQGLRKSITKRSTSSTPSPMKPRIKPHTRYVTAPEAEAIAGQVVSEAREDVAGGITRALAATSTAAVQAQTIANAAMTEAKKPTPRIDALEAAAPALRHYVDDLGVSLGEQLAKVDTTALKGLTASAAAQAAVVTLAGQLAALATRVGEVEAVPAVRNALKH